MTATILVVDDDAQIRDFLGVVLENLGHQVVSREGGADALEFATAQQPDLIILDVMMPVVDGFQMLWHLNSNEATRHIPTIVLTSRTSETNRQYGLSLGAHDYITKPIELPRLMACVDHLIQTGRQQPTHSSLN